MTLKQEILAEAYRLGFDLGGVTSPDPPPHLDIFRSWLKAGRQGEMDYLATERSVARRSDPRQLLPECRSILVLGMRYHPPGHEDSAGGSPKGCTAGKIAAYAWGEDYHAVIPDRLDKLAGFIAEKIARPLKSRAYTDTGPLLERDLAQRAGLGWIGKNTCLINPGIGSFVFLAELLLDLELEPDPPFLEDRCGSCTRCLDACPTRCILPDRTLDAARCLSYLTIELKGSIGAKLRPALGQWVFGCDICQQVCPWNERFASGAVEPIFNPRAGFPRPDLAQELELSQEGFSRKFRGSPIKRARRRGYLRNVAVALGNSADPQAIPALALALQSDPEPLVRAHAAWALGQLGGQAANSALREAARNEEEREVLEEVQAALDKIANLPE